IGILRAPQLQFMLAVMGADHLMDAIYYPYKQPKTSEGFLDTADLTDEQRAQIAFGTATTLFKL
ncbi:amidohydrolase, partial [Lactiplantibacillus plantarum]